MASPNPLHRTTPLVHLPLFALACLFLGPMIWLLATSLQPREQVGKVPPELLPRQYFISVSGERLAVTPPQPVGADRLLVEPAAGPNRGEQILVEPTQLRDGKLTQLVRVADRSEPQVVDARLIRRIESTDVMVKEWLLSKYNKRQPRVFYVKPSQVSPSVSPVWGNYPEAIKALTSGEKDKARPLSELLGASMYPWTDRSERGRTITFISYLSNTLLVAILGVTGTVLSSALVAYGLSRVQWKGRETLFTITLSTMMVPFPVLMIPLYSVFRALGWIGTLMPLWVPAFFGSAFNIFLLRQFFLTIPSELSEAARIDGCSELGIYWRIALPLMKPALGTLGLITFISSWNNFMNPLIVMRSAENYTLPLALRSLFSTTSTEWGALMAGSAIATLPLLVLFVISSRQLIAGLTAGAVK